jgi:circadian clock protein KaiC
MKKKHKVSRIETGVRNLDAILDGGLPKASVSVISGPPGSGKTILAQQLCFHAASSRARVLYFNTLSEPTAKTLRYLTEFDFFDPKKFERDVHFVDLGAVLRSQGIAEVSTRIMERVKKLKPAIVVIDSFKVFDDLSKSREELRKFGYELAVNLMAWEVTALLLGEYTVADYAGNPLFSVVDGLISLSQREQSGEQQRFVQVLKMRGTAQNRDEYPFEIRSSGIEVFAPRVTIQRDAGRDRPRARCKTGITKLDDLLGEGIPRGSSLLVAGVAGTGKTVLSLEFLYRGALAGEKGVLFSFEETTERLLAAAQGLGWELEREIGRGMIELVFIPQPEIMVERHLLMIREKVEALGAQRVVVDSVSVFLHKVKDPQISREKIFQLASIVQNAAAVGFFATDIPYGSNQISRLGVEETVVDGVVLLSATEEGFERQRYLEVYKLRNTAHAKGRHNLSIGQGGVQIFPRYAEESQSRSPVRALDTSERLSSGVAGLDPLLGGGFLKRSATLLAGSPGVGKTTFGLQFILEGAARREPGLIVTLEEGSQQLQATASALGLPLGQWLGEGLVEIVYLSHQHVRAAQFLAVLGDKIKKRKAQRLLLDSVTHIVRENVPADDLRRVLYDLVARFKMLDVTSMLTVESNSLYFGSDVTERGFSPVADNLLMLRYVSDGAELRPGLAVVKSRGSAHDRRVFSYEIGNGGLRLGPPMNMTLQRHTRKSARKKRRG